MTQNKELRTFKQEVRQNLAQSIKAEGMYNPIVVRPNPEKPGRFLLVAGEVRLYAKKKLLKERFIECNVLPTWTKMTMRWRVITENLWRSEISKAQRLLSVQRWHEHYVAKHTPKPKSEPAAATTNEQKTTEETSANLAEHGNALVAESNGEPSDEKALTAAKVEANFVRQLAAATGTSERSAHRKTRLAKKFSDDDLEIFHRMASTQQQIEAIAKVEDENKRKAVIAQIVSGLKFAEAWKDTFGKDIDLTASTKADKAEKAKAKEEKAPELSDEEWYEQHCSDKAKLLGNQTKFKADALYYREISEARANFRAAIKAAHKKRKQAGPVGFFWYAVNKVISISHPKDWFFCGECSGSGKDANGKECGKCWGGCFELRTEKYL